MTAPGRPLRRAADQRGLSTVEVVLAVGISVVIAGPLLLWGLFAIDQQRRTGDSLFATNGSALVGSYFSRDVPRAVEVDIPGSDCTGTETAGGEVHVTLTSGIAEQVTHSYVEVDRTEPGGATVGSLWRRVCGPGGTLRSETELLPRLVDDSTDARCVPATGPSACRQVELETQPSGTDRSLVVRGTRRVDAGAVNLGITNRPPRAVIVATPTSGNYPLAVSFSGSSSTDPEGAVASWEWEFPGGAIRTGVDQAWTFSEPGQHPVILTVTDAGGATHSAYVTIEATNQPPVARATASPLSGTLDTVFTFDASGSTDPEGAPIARYQWDFGGDDVQSTTTPVITHTFPVGTALGERDVALTVFDAWGASAGVPVRITLDGRPPTATAITYSPVKSATGVVSLPVRFAVTASDPDVSAGGITAWEWRVLSGTTPVWTSTEESPTLSTAPSGVGTYTVTVRVQDRTGAWSGVISDTFAVAPGAPAAPTWNKNALPGTVQWTAVANAQSYTIQVNQPGEACYKVWTVTAPATSSRYTPDCFNWWFDARVAVTVNGVTSSFSPWTRRL